MAGCDPHLAVLYSPCRTDEEAQWDGREGFVSVDLMEIKVVWIESVDSVYCY